ncbi:ArsA family ATPase [bacterium]|nr:ArsA family ATPase [candidate division CSSED10-310 bacterium]
MSTVSRMIREHDVLVCCGNGGVGKTTVSAALALLGALQGRNTLIMTIDPAKRLANALGLSGLSNRQAPIPREHLEQAGLHLEARLHAMMLDAKSTWDDLVARYAPTEAIRDRIYHNLIYRNLSDAMSGSQEYMALEKLYEVATDYDYDLIVVDTPPSRNAVDFLRAPLRMKSFVSNSTFFKLFLNPGMRAGKFGWRLVSSGGATLFKILERITGAGLLRDLAEFFTHFEEMIAGFGARASHIDDLIHSTRCAFILVATPTAPSLAEVNDFKQVLDMMKLSFWGHIINRVIPDPGAAGGIIDETTKNAAGDPAAVELLEYLEAIHALQHARFVEERRLLEDFSAHLPQQDHLVEIPVLPREVNDLSVLAEVADRLARQ